jgi:hypothetical protein
MSDQLYAAIAVIGIDIGKNSFHVVGLDQRGAIVLRQKWSRRQVETRLANIPPCLIGMEACVGAHHLSRKLTLLGHAAVAYSWSGSVGLDLSKSVFRCPGGGSPCFNRTKTPTHAILAAMNKCLAKSNKTKKRETGNHALRRIPISDVPAERGALRWHI